MKLIHIISLKVLIAVVASFAIVTVASGSNFRDPYCRSNGDYDIIACQNECLAVSGVSRNSPGWNSMVDTCGNRCEAGIRPCLDSYYNKKKPGSGTTIRKNKPPQGGYGSGNYNTNQGGYKYGGQNKKSQYRQPAKKQSSYGQDASQCLAVDSLDPKPESVRRQYAIKCNDSGCWDQRNRWSLIVMDICFLIKRLTS